jgi:hypothetical protein
MTDRKFDKEHDVLIKLIEQAPAESLDGLIPLKVIDWLNDRVAVYEAAKESGHLSEIRDFFEGPDASLKNDR